MKISIERLKEIIKEELATDDHQEYQQMYAKNEASELRLIYNDLIDSLGDDVTWHGMLMDLDEQIRDKIEQIEIKLNEPTK